MASLFSFFYWDYYVWGLFIFISSQFREHLSLHGTCGSSANAKSAGRSMLRLLKPAFSPWLHRRPIGLGLDITIPLGGGYGYWCGCKLPRVSSMPIYDSNNG